MSTLDFATRIELFQYGLEAMAIPDYVAGFMYGMTGDNHLEEIEGCYTGGTSVISDAQEALNLIKQGKYKKGAADFWLVWHEVDNALTSCKNMDDDLAAIRSWATIFTQPEELAKTVGKNWLLHRRTIKEDITKEQSDWASQAYF